MALPVLPYDIETLTMTSKNASEEQAAEKKFLR